MIYIFIILILILAISLTLIMFLKVKKENFLDYIENNQKIINLLLQDKDNFFKNLTKYDMIARKYKSYDDYKNKILRAFTFDPKYNQDSIKKINILTKMADFIIGKKYPFISEIPWKIIFFNGSEYEDKCPHVRFNIIFLPINIINNVDISNKNNVLSVINTLIHEKIHLFQKINPQHPFITNFFKDYKKVISRKEFQEKYNPFVRSNPDLDDWIYSDKKGKLLYNEFKSKNPFALYDTLQSPNNEHPYEIMAYNISQELTQNINF